MWPVTPTLSGRLSYINVLHVFFLFILCTCDVKNDTLR